MPAGRLLHKYKLNRKYMHLATLIFSLYLERNLTYVSNIVESAGEACLARRCLDRGPAMPPLAATFTVTRTGLPPLHLLPLLPSLTLFHLSPAEPTASQLTFYCMLQQSVTHFLKQSFSQSEFCDLLLVFSYI